VYKLLLVLNEEMSIYNLTRNRR